MIRSCRFAVVSSLASALLFPPPAFAATGEVVILAHGMGRTRLSMIPLKWSLQRAGYRVINWGYSSTRHTIPELSEQLARKVTRLEADSSITRIHFVGHSLGGILIRDVLSRRAVLKAGRVVLLAPPNRGSRLADQLSRILASLWPPILGLTTDATSFVNSIGPLPSSIEVGIIVGDRDGKVSVEETFLAGQKDHIVVRSGHAFLMNHREVRRLTVWFLRTGEFRDNLTAETQRARRKKDEFIN